MMNLNNEKLINSCIESSKCISKLTINKLRTLCRDNPDKFMTIMNNILGCKTSINKKGNTIFIPINKIGNKDH